MEFQDYQESDAREQSTDFSKKFFSTRFSLDWELNRRNEVYSYGEIGVQVSRKTLEVEILNPWTTKSLMRGTKLITVLLRNSIQKKTFDKDFDGWNDYLC